MIQLAEMKQTLPIDLHGGAHSTTTQVWEMLTASRDGDLERVRSLIEDCPALSTCQYNYTPPLHFAVREGHLPLVRELVSLGGLDPTYKTYPFLDLLLTIADDRGHTEIAKFLQESLDTPGVPQVKGDTGRIEFGLDETAVRFQKAVNHDSQGEVRELLNENPELARNELMSWGEGILAMPANRRNRKMLELLMQYGARVPDVTKWGRAYYFKHYDVAKFLMDSGMNPNHLSWQGVTLLHDMAHDADIPKARLLLDHGADINAIDDEYQSTPLGIAARWGNRDMVTFLIERGADPNKAGAQWATPLAWARKKGHKKIEKDLKRSGAV
jgi:uncharacterized protein